MNDFLRPVQTRVWFSQEQRPPLDTDLLDEVPRPTGSSPPSPPAGDHAAPAVFAERVRDGCWGRGSSVIFFGTPRKKPRRHGATIPRLKEESTPLPRVRVAFGRSFPRNPGRGRGPAGLSPKAFLEAACKCTEGTARHPRRARVTPSHPGGLIRISPFQILRRRPRGGGLGAGVRRPTGRSSPSSSLPYSGALPPPEAPWPGGGPSSANPAP